MSEVKYYLIFLAVTLCMNATGEQLAVPGEYASIQAAMDAAASGDIVEVGPGVYEENLLFKANIELKGAGPDSTIVRTASTNGEVMKVIDATGGSVTGFKFEHTDVASVDPNEKNFVAAVDVINSSVEIRNCILGPSAGTGIIVEKKSNSRVVECRAEGNSNTGIHVLGEGTEAMLLRNVCSNNKWGGISLSKGSKAVVEENRCLNNNRWGARALNRDTSIVLKNNTITGNAGLGILIDKWAHGVVEGNTCLENENNGIFFKLGATGAIVGNTCEKNMWNGIVVQSLAVNVEVRNNTCVGNGYNGIIICLGAGGEAVRNTCKGNTLSGIYVFGWFSNPVVKENVCDENMLYGISFNGGAKGKAEGNTCRKNKEYGIFVSDENTEPDIGNNNCEENGNKDFVREEGAPISRQYQVDREEIGCILAGEHFDQLEEMARLLRQHKCRHRDGGWQLEYFYEEMKKGCDDITPSQQEVFKDLLERWKKAYPESVTPFIVQAKVHSTYGWDARGGGYADTVTDEGWRIFHKELGIAKDCLLKAEALNSNDPQFYATLVDVCNCTDNSSAELQAIFDKGAAIDVGYFPLYKSRAWTLTRRWGGRRGELEWFAKNALALTQEEYGHTMYALIAASLATCMGDEDFVADHFFDWEKVDKGSRELINAFPESSYYLNQYCLLTCLYQYQEQAKTLFNKIGRNPDQSVWRCTAGFNRWQQWAFDMAPAPCAKAYDGKPGILSDFAMFDFLPLPVRRAFYRMALIGGVVLLALGVITVVLVLAFVRRKMRRPPIPLGPPEPAEDGSNDDSGTAS